MTLTLDVALAAVMAGAERFGHRQHLHLAWMTLREYPTEADAEEALAGWPQELAGRHGTPERYSCTRTRAWARLVSHHLRIDDGAGGFDEFLGRHPGLLDPRLLERHWSTPVLSSGRARAGWLPPDLLPLPAG